MKGEAFHKGKLEVAKARAACMKDAKVAKQIAPFQKVMDTSNFSVASALTCAPDKGK